VLGGSHNFLVDQDLGRADEGQFWAGWSA